MLKKSLAVATGISCCGLLAATELTEEDLIQQMPMVIAATRLPQPVKDTSGSITVLDRELIAASGFVEVGDLFRLVPGFQVALSWRDHHTVTTYHGQTDGLSRRMQVLVDGRTAFTSQFGLTNWDRLGITVQDIERIEVMRGPAGAAYGSNAFVAAINIVTREPVTSPETELFTTVGSAHTRIAGVRYRHAGERLEYTASTTYLSSNGFEQGNSEVDVVSLRLQGHYRLADDRMLDFQVGHADGPSGRGGSPSSLLDPVGKKRAKEQHTVLRLTQSLSPHNEWYLQFSYDRTSRRDNVRPGTVAEVLAEQGIGPAQLDQYLAEFPVDFAPGFADLPTVAGPYNYRANRIDIEGQQILSFNGHSRLVWGAGLRTNRIKGGLVLQSNDYFDAFNGRLHGNWEYRHGDFLYNIGALLEEGDLATGDLSSRVGANYELTDNQTLRASFARGWRQPFVGEAYHELALKTEDGFPLERFIEVPGPLNPERIITWELGYLGNWGALRTELKLFKEHISNEIQEIFDPTEPELISLFARDNGQPPGVVSRINGGETDLRGVEGNLNYRFGRGSRLWLSYAYTSVNQQLPPLAIRGLNHSNKGTPRHTVSMLLSQQLGSGWEAGLGYYYLDDTAWFLFGGDTKSYDRVDVRLAKRFNIGSRRGKLELIGQNLGGSYSEFTPQNQFDTRVFIRFGIKLD